MRKSAIISPCLRYRYELRREWNDALPPFVIGMLNPSVADATQDDPTIARNLRRAEANGCGSLIVWNLGAGRATSPIDWKAMSDPIGPENDRYFRQILTECHSRNGKAVVGWGNLGAFRGRDKAVTEIGRQIGVNFLCLGVTASGQPRHPLYVAYSQQLTKWQGSSCGDFQNS